MKTQSTGNSVSSVPAGLDLGTHWGEGLEGFLEPPDCSREDMYRRVSCLQEGGSTIGTCIRLEGGVILTARHCISAPDLVRGHKTKLILCRR